MVNDYILEFMHDSYKLYLINVGKGENHQMNLTFNQVI